MNYASQSGISYVEIGQHGPRIAIRDTEDRSGLLLTFDVGAWKAFTADLKREPQNVTSRR